MGWGVSTGPGTGSHIHHTVRQRAIRDSNPRGETPVYVPLVYTQSSPVMRINRSSKLPIRPPTRVH